MSDISHFMTPKYQPGDRVLLTIHNDRPGRVAMVSGFHGPRGEPIYRVVIGRRPLQFIISLESNLRPAPPKAASRPADGGEPAA